ncbi:MAG: MATE family efflux transporter [Oscillospiraceae bacterium]|nr:MATE family efflux transporter [Oscillospiraceae bacterium]
MKKLWDRKFFLFVLGIAVPIMVQNAITNFVALLDNIMIGQLGTEEMSGVAIINQLLFVFNVTLFGACAGAGIFTSQFHGSGNPDGVRQTFRYKLLLGGILLAASLLVLCLWGTPLIQAWLHQSSSTGDLALTLSSAQGYLKIMLWGLLPYTIKEVYASTLRETGRSVPPMVAGLIAVAVNLFLNYLLIFGKWGMPRLGITGGAIATVVSRVVECAVVIVWTHRNTEKNPYIVGVYRSFHIQPKLAKSITCKGMPLLFNELLWSGAVAVLSRCYAQRGLDIVAG